MSSIYLSLNGVDVEVGLVSAVTSFQNGPRDRREDKNSVTLPSLSHSLPVSSDYRFLRIVLQHFVENKKCKKISIFPHPPNLASRRRRISSTSTACWIGGGDANLSVASSSSSDTVVCETVVTSAELGSGDDIDGNGGR